MLKYCKNKWSENEDLLKQALTLEKLTRLDYQDLVKLSVKWILNSGSNNSGDWDYDNIRCIDDGDYQGTQLYIIPKHTYQPSEYEYLMTYVGYGSCSGCDTLLSMQCDRDNIDEYVKLCKDIICNIIKPYNCGWRNEEEFEVVEL